MSALIIGGNAWAHTGVRPYKIVITASMGITIAMPATVFYIE